MKLNKKIHYWELESSNLHAFEIKCLTKLVMLFISLKYFFRSSTYLSIVFFIILLVPQVGVAQNNNLIKSDSGQKQKIVAKKKNNILPVLANTNNSYGKPILYKVKYGDELGFIAISHHVYIDEIAHWNNLHNLNKLDTGKVLIVGYEGLHTHILPKHSNSIANASVNSNAVAHASVPLATVQKANENKVAKHESSTPIKEKNIQSEDHGTVVAKDTLKHDSLSIAKRDSIEEAYRKDSVALEKAKANAQFKGPSKWLKPSFYVHRISHQPLIVTSLIIFTTLLIFVILILLTMIIILRVRTTVNEAISNLFGNAFEDLITGVIYADHEIDSSLADDEFDAAQLSVIAQFEKKYLTNEFQRQLCIDHLLNLYRNLTGVSAARVVNLYHAFKLDQDSLSKIKDRHWHIKAKGIQEVEQMHVQEAYSMVYSYIDHPIDTLRFESQIAVMSLKDERNLVFLEELKLPLTDWQQMMLANKLHIIRNRDFSNMPSLLSCSNTSVICLGVKIVQDFNMLSYVPRLIELIHHESPMVKTAVAAALGGLIAKEALPALFLELRTASVPVKESILASVAAIGFDDHISEVSKYVFHDNFEVAHAAANALVSSGEKGVDALRKIVNTNEENIGIQVFNSYN